MAQAEPWVYRHNLRITTPRLILRDWSPDDAECVAAVYRMRTDPIALKYVAYKSPDSLAEARAYLQTRTTAAPSFNFIVELRHPPDPQHRGQAANIVGMCGGIRVPEFGYQIESTQWGQGYAVEAMRAAVHAYWDTWPEGMPCLPPEQRHTIALHILPEHAASIAVARKLGFHRAGEEQVEEDGRNGTKELVTLAVYELQRPQGPRSGEPGASPRAYEKIESLGPNQSAGPP